MCGIAGFVAPTFGNETRHQYIQKMIRSIAHRGPDDEGIWCDSTSGTALAHRRLSIIDLSHRGHQPMLSEDGRYAIVFNGEIYNFLALKEKLDHVAAINWRGDSDTEVLLAAISTWGIKRALEESVGMFALGIWDSASQTLTLARDRVGEKPLYYGWLGDSFVFASELKALRQHPHWAQSIDRNSLALLMRHGYIPAPYSIFEGIYKLRPGHLLSMTHGCRRTTIEKYWSLSDIVHNSRTHQFRGSPQEAVERLDQLLRQALAGQMTADVPLGAFLSGGIDSSTIVALMQSLSDKPVHTFSIGFDVPNYNEAAEAKAVANHLGTDHTELYVTEKDAFEVVPRLPDVYSEPFADSSQIPTYLLSRLARQKLTVSLSGDAGDELFSGYSRYNLTDDIWRRLSFLPPWVRTSASTLLRTPTPGFYDAAIEPVMRLFPRHLRYRFLGDKIHKAAQLLSVGSPDELYLKLCSLWQDPSALVLGATEPPTMLTGLDPIPEFAGTIEKMMYLDLMSYLPDDILVKVDRAAMSVGLETRVPLLDHRVVEFAMSLPLSVLQANGKSKWPLRQVLSRYVPNSLVDRPKMGFAAPIGEWLRGALHDWAEDLLSEDILRRDGFFHPTTVRAVWHEHLSGRRNNQYPLWSVLMFQAWLHTSKMP
jgi:asparagine synthase (glutamine-hydrolysing)